MTDSTKFRKKPIVVEATQWSPIRGHHAVQLADKNSTSSPCKHCGLSLITHGWINTLEGGHIVCPGDWIITGVKGEHHPCKPDIFAMTYEPVEAGNGREDDRHRAHCAEMRANLQIISRKGARPMTTFAKAYLIESARIKFTEAEPLEIEAIKISGVELTFDEPIILEFGEKLVVQSDGARTALIGKEYPHDQAR